ncbi:hypothetical protein FZ025_01535 [Xanthomonas hyacinthi]|uniref:Poly(Hydroxyalcanoate) granule associated protein n=1 Tax=Xanthomonas hyacinthi TaxID=56455 RepID=A0A2S7ESH7_9XANT|nr:hypothetical protein [Xanthomonas hyacinthi]KLD74334.1 hypothetical protein Y886_33165 [Xanthomonas hyacinthi DSM 19077]PPU96050.1 hypothetical protein XhyaCFBP1156_16680 [Xanthomonas hyacinthi]QGY75412.1 hypothetical protein FZ025_01535 [Xanthomonas hyacinthi]
MATKKRSTSAPRPETLAPRHLWLAGLGLLSLTRKRALAAAADAASGANTLKALVAQLADDAEASVREGAAALRGQVQPLSAEVEARLQPVLVKLGLQPKPRATPRKRPAATTPGKRTAKKTAAAARRPRSAAKRSARSR